MLVKHAELYKIMLPDPGRNLAGGHFIHGFDPDDPSPQMFPLELLSELHLCLARTEYPNRIRIADRQDDPPHSIYRGDW